MSSITTRPVLADIDGNGHRDQTMQAAETGNFDAKADTKLKEKLNNLNKKFRLGLSISNYPTVLRQPNYIEPEEQELWAPINQAITTWHKDHDRRQELNDALNSYRAWANKSGERVQWRKKSNGHPRTLPEPTSHITQLKFVLGISEYSSSKYASSRRKRKSEEMADRAPPGRRSEDSIQYPKLPTLAQADGSSPHPQVITDLLQAKVRKHGVSQEQYIIPAAAGSNTADWASNDHLDFSSRKRPRTAATEDKRPAGDLSNVSIKANSRDTSKTSFKSAPSTQVTTESATTSFRPSFTESFTSAQDVVDTPATSFGSNGVQVSMSQSMGPPAIPKPRDSTQTAKARSIPASHAIQVNDIHSNLQLDEFPVTSSFEEILVDALETLPTQRVQSTNTHSISQVSTGFEAQLMDLERQHDAEMTISRPSQSSQRTLAMFTPPSSGQTVVASQRPCKQVTSKVFDNDRSLAPGRNIVSSAVTPASVKSGVSSSRSTSAMVSHAPSLATRELCASIPGERRNHTQAVGQPIFADKKSPFEKARLVPTSGFSFREVYELTRVALKAGKTPEDLAKQLSAPNTGDYDTFWRNLAQQSGKKLEKSAKSAWDAATPNSVVTSLGGKLQIKVTEKKTLETSFTLSPLRTDKSYRLSRKFGANRFFVLDLPDIREEGLADRFNKWLRDSCHEFLGRTWRVFFSRDLKNADKKSDYKFQAVLFAVEGNDISDPKMHMRDIKPGDQSSVSDFKLLNWLLNFKQNEDQPALKLFSRIGLGLTKTTPTKIFDAGQIVRCDDAWSCCPGRRSLVKDAETAPHHEHPGKVMNDGCGRISYAAAQDIRRMLKLSYLPSAFQGRIAGAKGVWLVDETGERYNDQEIWIEITHSQHKFEALLQTQQEDGHRTFEVHSHSHPLSAQHLSYTLIPVLLVGFAANDRDRNIDNPDSHREVFTTLLIEELARMQMKMDEAMDGSHEALLEWLNAIHPVSGERASSGEIRMTGGLPDSLGEKLLRLAASGHSPKTDRIMADLCIEAARQYFRKHDEKHIIGMPKSTNVLMVPDPFGVLEEGEIFLQLSEGFENEDSGEAVRFLDTEVLITRYPAYLPSDVQKVTAVIRNELMRYQDVVVFSTKGQRSLADLLSGGDFDGDKAWVCWEPRLVTMFKNSPFQEPPSPCEFGIIKDTETYGHVRKRNKRAFQRKGIAFNMRPNMLGLCASWYMSWVYHKPHSDPELRSKVGGLLAYLVDTAKNGYTFGRKEWREWRAVNHVNVEFEKPAWKKASATRAQADYKSIEDYLRFWVTADFRDATLARYIKHRDGLGSYDGSLSTVFHEQVRSAGSQSSQLEYVVKHVEKELDLIKEGYLRIVSKAEGVAWLKDDRRARSFDSEAGSDSNDGTFRERIHELRRQFLAVEPPAECTYHLVPSWQKEARAMALDHVSEVDATFGSWTRFKASLLNYRIGRMSKFCYLVAGKELCDIKATQTTPPSQIWAVTQDTYTAMKIDKKFVQQKQGKLPESVACDEENEDTGSQFAYGMIDDE